MVGPDFQHDMATPYSLDHPPPGPICGLVAFDEQKLDTSDWFTRTIGPEDTQLAFGAYTQHPQTSSTPSPHADDASTLLADLARLAPSVAKDFVTKTEAARNLEFRLIHNVNDQLGGDLLGKKRYIAISYVCKSSNADRPTSLTREVGALPFGWVRTDVQFPLPVKKSVFMGVLQERYKEEGLWFDQVCVEQHDETERAFTIANMDSIYRNARMVGVALDDITASWDEVCWLHKYLGQCDYADLNMTRGFSPSFMENYPPFRSFFERVLGSAWFERAWCMLEMRAARWHVFFVPCPDREGEAGRVVRFTAEFFYRMLVLASEVSTMSYLQKAQIHSLIRFFGSVYPDGERKTSSIPPTHPSLKIPRPVSLITTVAQIFRMRTGGNPRLPGYLRLLDANRDKIAITLSISNIPIAHKPITAYQRPTTEDECLRKLLLIGLAARDPVALCTTGTPLRLHDNSLSWLCRPSIFDIPFSTGAHGVWKDFEARTEIRQGSDGKAEFVELGFVFLHLPHRSRPNPHFTSHIQRAREIIHLCSHFRVQGVDIWNLWQAQPTTHPRGPALRNLFVQTLACAFECGVGWFLDTANILLLLPSSNPNMGMLIALFNPHLALAHFMTHAAALGGLEALVNVLAGWIGMGVPWASGADEVSHGPVIVEVVGCGEEEGGGMGMGMGMGMQRLGLQAQAQAHYTRVIPHPPPFHPSQHQSHHLPQTHPLDLYQSRHHHHHHHHHFSLPTPIPSHPPPPPPSSASPSSSSSPLPPSHHSTKSSPLPPPPLSPLFKTQKRSKPRPYKAILFAPFSCSKALAVAVPEVVRGMEYRGLARAWVLVVGGGGGGSFRLE
ncbi:hypothetical protein P280DRAFT_505662 [Massarina eburnea CBS 473.64]|uniref:Heterokaryon incompatibility domain-containing protein n=1 Tax=Massarina eburnea CBS 473.64 TaxID=1395130 RepID=A0A6A6S9Z9_9PLEO|nr:hypothetical protein P280DRAFT_505662 [Massarina eburnea CBS 473.64]